ncbi:hypothetical protein AND_010253 [Anopheles darlingi]|uniref:Uncharacterized protein n=1 Tax=Anopheles darlingi TaxID=43151 RepID=W5J1Q9_ANODA|nr:hypothetical protein AND_010253 [Anopheles darlingi]
MSGNLGDTRTVCAEAGHTVYTEWLPRNSISRSPLSRSVAGRELADKNPNLLRKIPAIAFVSCEFRRRIATPRNRSVPLLTAPQASNGTRKCNISARCAVRLKGILSRPRILSSGSAAAAEEINPYITA